MNKKISNVGIMTSGGDCPGINSAIASIVKACENLGISVFGFINENNNVSSRAIELNLDLMHKLALFSGRPGSIIGSMNNKDIFNEEIYIRSLKSKIADNNIDAMIFIGGDGSGRIVQKVSPSINVPFVYIPKTIDNDISFTDCALGSSTAINTIVNSVDQVRSSAYSHNYIALIEVMGRDSGYLALNSGVASLADIILIPEIPYNQSFLNTSVQSAMDKSQHGVIIICSESAREEGSTPILSDNGKYGGKGEGLSNKLSKDIGKHVKYVRLGHTQRGGIADWKDRSNSFLLGSHAIEALISGHQNIAIGINNGNIDYYPIADIKNFASNIDVNKNEVYKAAIMSGISFGRQ